MAKLKTFKLPVIEQVKRWWANFRNEPWIWVDMGHMIVDDQGMLEVRFEHNDHMVDYLRDELNYQGSTDDEVVQKYIMQVVLHIEDEDENPLS